MAFAVVFGFSGIQSLRDVGTHFCTTNLGRSVRSLQDPLLACGMLPSTCWVL